MDIDDLEIADLRNRARALAAKRRLTELANKAGLTQPWVTRFCQGEYARPRYHTVMALRRALVAMEEEPSAA